MKYKCPDKAGTLIQVSISYPCQSKSMCLVKNKHVWGGDMFSPAY